MLQNYAKKSLLFLAIAVAIYFNYLFVKSTEGLEKIFGYAFAFCVLTPLLFNTFTFFIIPTKVKESKSNSRVVHKTNTKSEYKDTSNVRQFTSKKEPVKVDNTTYEAIRNILIACSKHKLFSREDILDILGFINYKLGSSVNHYAKFTFDNDMHEIYTKLKNKKFTDSDYQEILSKIETITNNFNFKEETINGQII